MNLYDIRKNLINSLMEYEKEMEYCNSYRRSVEVRENILYLQKELRRIEDDIWNLENREV